MKSSKRFFLLSVCLAITCAFAETPKAELVQSGHWSFEALKYLFLESGSAPAATHAPATKLELSQYLAEIPYDSLSEGGKAIWRKLDAFLSPRDATVTSAPLSFDVRPVLTLSARYVQDTDAYFYSDQTERFNETNPLVSVPLLLGFGNSIAGYTDLSLGEGYWASSFKDDWTNVPVRASDIDLTMPKTAYLASGNEYLTAVIGRGPLESGLTLTGGLGLSGTADRLDYATIAFHSKKLRYSLTPIELAPKKFAYFHELTVRPVKALSVSLSEASMVASSMDLRYLNPFMIFHSYAGWRDDYGTNEDSDPVGSEFVISADFVPHPGVRLYGQFVMNQFQTSYERDNFADADVTPNSLGGLVGIEVAHSYRSGFLIATVEGVYANPWLYILSGRDISYQWTRKELVAPSGYTGKAVQGWLGTPFGPDTMAIALQVKYDEPLDYSLRFGYRFLCKGENDAAFLGSTGSWYPSSVSEAEIDTPSGSDSMQHSVCVAADKFIGERLEIQGKLGYSYRTGTVRAGSVEASCAVSWYPANAH